MAGASAYVFKQLHGSELIFAVHSLAAGQSLLDPSATTKLMTRLCNNQQKKGTCRAGRA
jgi:two-component system, NarL family, response regulator DevR